MFTCSNPLPSFPQPTIIKDNHLPLPSLTGSSRGHHYNVVSSLIRLSFLYTMTAEMGTGQRSSFAVTCNLLSQYIKENNRALGDLRGVRLPMTMSLLPGVETEKEGELGRTAAARSMDLFPQQTGFGSPPAVDVSNGAPEKSQLTIFYGGKVMVFDNFPAEKAKDLMQMAGKGAAATAQNFQFTALSPAPAPADSATANPANAPAKKPVEAEQGSASKPPQPQPNVSYLPIRRKQSLHRFMEKRKERIQARTPYQTSESTGKVKQEQEENQSWLGLGAQVSVKPSLSSECS